MTLHLPPGARGRSQLSIPRAALDRRRFLGLAGLGVTAAALSACGGGPDTSGGGGKASSGVKQVDFSGVKPAKEITFWSTHPGNSGQVTAEIIKAFQAESGITVKLVQAGADYEELAQKFQTAQTSGDLPDVVNLSDVWWFRYMINGQIIPLDSAFEAAEVETDKYVESLLGDYNYNDATWAAPWARSTPLFYYNIDAFKKAGIDPEKALTSWDEFAAAAPDLVAKGGTKSAFQMPALAGYGGWVFQNLLWGYGGGWSKEESFDITCDSAESVAAIQFAQDAVYKDKWAGVAGTDQIQDFAAGVAAATMGSTGDLITTLTSAKFEVGVAPLLGGPEAAGGEDAPVCPTGGSGVAIPAEIPAERQLAAAQFIKFLTSPENTLKFAEATGYMPVRTDADPAALVKKTPQAKVAIDQLPATRPQDYARVFLPNGDIEMANALSDILTKKADPADSLGTLKTTLEDIYTSKVEPKL
ncbi:sn-glycerol 3-phosphate transport system substrate-binding protein [Nocardioides luteus]|uniref:ABC transporter substrate-binding protein n=1 Tax=Nocardioides luteus TaxID=1844 RepID=A0ABQ5SWG7_9ACTN|nr:ABC transporter substrate-binding protein [Nocardioides luteus]MDR7312272.1 sn-glycerol 3-phosphate transport system substrate-binding protein [Nocardioides luteus]GGR57142.1 ABC transporter substrate-binding protein [Nocardioides luteus]GLJ68518.1 ABC transporter substrate-binding protein [Nocardioides luteus]